MPTTIPYDPSLVLANIVDPEVLDNLKAIGAAQNPPDKAHDSLNALLMSRRSLEMTRTELLNLGITVDGISEAIQEMDRGINDKAKEWARLMIAAETQIAELRAKVIGVKDLPETPVDLLKTEVKIMPLASDTINMDVQYFSLDTMNQDSRSFADQIAGFVSASTSWMGVSASTKMSTTVQTQVAQQSQTHEITGTLVISVSCSHKDAAMLAPCILNVDKAIKVWNHFHPGPNDRIEAKTLDEMKKIANPVVDTNIINVPVTTEEPKKYSILSGVTYGSSFVGMVHILNNSTTFSSQSLSTVASSLQGQMDIGGWFAKFSGGFGVDASFSDSVKSLLSSQNVMSHVSMACMGCIPSIVANEVQIGVKQFADFDPKADMEALASFQNSTASVQESIGQSAEAARTGQQMVSLQTGKIKAAIGALADVDDGKNKVLDVNSLMTALEDYVQKVNEAKCGVPINYYLKDITRDMLADMWIAKYFPGADGPTITYDDQDPPEKPAPPLPVDPPPPVDDNGDGEDDAAAAREEEEAGSPADAGGAGKENEAEGLPDPENAPEPTI